MFLFTVFTIVGFVIAIAVALPLNSQRSQITVTQLLQGEEVVKTIAKPGTCIDVLNSAVPTAVTLNKLNSQNYQMVKYYDTNCATEYNPMDPVKPQEFSDTGIITINERIPIGSVRLQNTPRSNVNVILIGFNGNTFTSKDLRGTGCISDFTTTAPWTKYATSLRIELSSSNKVSRQGVDVFQGKNCEETTRIAANLSTGADLVRRTLIERERVESFRIIKK